MTRVGQGKKKRHLGVTVVASKMETGLVTGHACRNSVLGLMGCFYDDINFLYIFLLY